MKPNFDDMSKAELKAYVLAHRDDDEAIRVLFGRRNPPDSEATWYPPLSTPEGLPIEEILRIAEEALRKRLEKQQKKLEKEEMLEAKIRQQLEHEYAEKLRQKEIEIEQKIRQELQQEKDQDSQI